MIKNIFSIKGRSFLLVTLTTLTLVIGAITPLVGLFGHKTAYADYHSTQFVSPTTIAVSGSNGDVWTLGQIAPKGGETYYFYYHYNNHFDKDGRNQYEKCLDNPPAKVPNGCIRLSFAESDPKKGLTQQSGGSRYGGDTPITVGKTELFDAAKAKAAIQKYGEGKVPVSKIDPATGQLPATQTCDGGAKPDTDGNCPDDKNALDCGAGSFNWIICSGIELMTKTSDGLQNLVISQLTVPVDKIFDDGTNGSAYYKAWSSFRLLATAIIVIAGLVMVASQAFGFEFLDAYTIRKTLPRLLIAIIGISLSWPILRFMIGFFNTLGLDLAQLMYGPFASLGDSGGTGGLILISNPLTLLAAGTAAFLAFGPAIFTFLITIFLALVIAFVLFAVRQIAIVVLVIAAPIAIACYILPNTQKVWNLWRENFFGLLMVFPIVTMLIAAGQIMSVTGRAPGSSTFQQILAVIAYFIPYFLIPLAFRLATGLVGNLAGFVNDRGKGAFDRLKKVRSNALANNMQDMKNGTRTNNRAFNALSSRATTKRGGFGTQGRAAYNQKMDLAAMEHMKSAGGQAVQHNDDALRALTYASEADARANMARSWRKRDGSAYSDSDIDQAIGAAKASGGFGRARQVFAAQQLAATGTGYENLEQVAQTIARVSHGNVGQASSLAGNINSATKQASRYDLAPGFGQLDGLAQAEMGGGATQEQYHTASVRAARGVDAVTLLRGKPQQVQTLTTSLANHAQRQYTRSQSATDPDERQAATEEYIQTMGQIDQLTQSKSYASPENQAQVNAMLDGTTHLRGQGLDDVLGRTYDSGGERTDLFVDPTTGQNTRMPGQGVSQQHVDNRNLFEQARAPIRNPNDPDIP